MRVTTPEVKQLIKRAFPKFNGRRISVEMFRGPMSLASYWSGGYRDYYAVLPLDPARSNAVLTAPQNGTPFDAGEMKLSALPEDCAVVCLHAGPHESVTVYVNQANLTPMLAAPVELTGGERTVLSYTAKLKPSYAGISNYRFHEANRDTGIQPAEWEASKASLIAKGLLNKAGAITDNGRNAL